MPQPSLYKTERAQDHGVEIVRLTDAAQNVEVRIAPSAGNRAYEMNVNGANILHMPAASIAELREMSGIPFLAPWANRIPHGFHANGKWFPWNESLGNLRMLQPHIAIHGMLPASNLWQITEATADADAAWVSSRLEFWRYPALMANWPFAHEYEMTYRLANGELETSIALRNLSAEPMPVAIGFHPYFRLPGVPRDNCTARIPARSAVVTDSGLCATGEFRANTLPDPLPLANLKLDDGFTDLIRDASGNAIFVLEGGGARLEVEFGLKWQVAVVYCPSGHEFICFEPMAAVTNGVNLAAEGKYPALQTLEPGDTWRESFRVRAAGVH
ncbi:MAG TPA: aldose 1-epimerase [Bryobacteraceae bacterium]|nr:aldose 1-epimerase [Bryobacteraceae bacterium]